MKITSAVAITLGIVCFAAMAFAAADDASFPNTKWIHTFWAKKTEPKREYYLGQLDAIGHTDNTDAASSGIYSIWGKVKFYTPQQSPQGTYTEDVYNIKLTCQTTEIVVLREIKLAEDGSIVSDVRPTASPKKVDAQAPQLVALPYDEALAINAMDFTCGGDAD